MSIANIIPLFVVVPLAGAFLIPLARKKMKQAPDVMGNIVTLVLAALSILTVALTSHHGTLVYSVGAHQAPVGIALVLDSLTSLMLVTANLVAFLVTVFSVNYMKRYTSKWKFYTLFLLMLAGMNGVIIAGDMFNMFVFLEIASVASYALVAFGTEKHEIEAAFKYAVMGIVASLFILLGIVLMYSYTSTLNMADMARFLLENGKGNITLMVSVLFLVGFGLKAALVPFHAWLPDAHPSAPAPISAMLSGVLIKSLGIYALCRIFFNVIGMDPIMASVLMVLGTISMVTGGILALKQKDFKRLLAYSSISQIGYIIIGFGLGTPLGILGSLFHLFNHSVFKSLLFLNSGAVEYSTGTRNLDELGGLSSKMPVTSGTALIGSMSISGIPPFSGFWSKLIIIVAMVQAGRVGYAFWAVLVSVLTLAMYTKIMQYAFFGTLKEKWNQIKEVPGFMKISMITLAFMCLVGGVLLLENVNMGLFNRAQGVLSGGLEYASILLKGTG